MLSKQLKEFKGFFCKYVLPIIVAVSILVALISLVYISETATYYNPKKGLFYLVNIVLLLDIIYIMHKGISQFVAYLVNKFNNVR